MLNELISRYPCLDICKDDIVAATEAIIDCYKKGGKVLLCGNGGSCADCDHIVGELMKGFLKLRPLTEEKKAQMKANCPLVDDDILNKAEGAVLNGAREFTLMGGVLPDADIEYYEHLLTLLKDNYDNRGQICFECFRCFVYNEHGFLGWSRII